jgi:hypothetical protein
MPVTSTSKTLVNPGDTLVVSLVNVGVGQQGSYSFALLFFTGSWSTAVVSVSGITFPPSPPPIPLPLNLLTGNGEMPLPPGPITLTPESVAGFANGYAFSCCCPLFKSIQVQLVSISPLPGSSFASIAATVETVSYP